MAASSVSFQDSNVSMEDLLNESDLQVADIRPGTVIHGKVVGFQGDSVIVDTGGKSEGRIPLREFDSEPLVNDNIEAIVKSIDRESGLVNVSKRELEQRRGWELVKDAYEKQAPVSGIVKRNMKQGYLVNVEGLLMFLPHSQVGSFSGVNRRKKSDVIGSTISAKILEVNQRRRTGVLSRKAFQDEQNESRWKDLIGNVNIGDIVQGKVVKHTKAGAFVSVVGVEGFLHKSNISWERKIGNFREKLPLDSDIQVRVLEIDPENHRLSLGLKQLTDDPWLTVMDKFQVGDIAEGTVTFVANYGAFVDLAEGLEGLVHISEMSWTRKINHAQDMLREGQEVQTKIIGINPEDKRISLGIRQLHDNPWEKLEAELEVGQVMKSKVKDVTNFGVFVAITDEIDGLIRKEDLNWDEPAPDPRKLYKSGDEVEFKIIDINLVEHKIGCSIRHLLPNPYKELKRDYPRGTVVEGEVSGVVDFGIFIRFDKGYEGLAHLSTMDKEQAANPRKAFSKGEKIQAVIKSIDPEKRKISLSIRDVAYAKEREEIKQYITKEKDSGLETSNPFAKLKDQLK